METTIMGLYRGYIGIIGSILGLYRDNGKENGNCYLGCGFLGLPLVGPGQGLAALAPIPFPDPLKDPKKWNPLNIP